MKGFVFDLDGTLVDSTATLLAAINSVLGKHGLRASDESENMKFAGWGLMPMFHQTALARTGDEEKAFRLADEMLAVYMEDPINGTVSYPGAYGFLKELNEKGAPLAVITNKHLEPAGKILESCFPGISFSFIYTPDQGYPAKPSNASLVDFKERFGVDSVTYTGDTELDYRTAYGTADEINIALWGYRGKEKLMSWGIPEELFIKEFSEIKL